MLYCALFRVLAGRLLEVSFSYVTPDMGRTILMREDHRDRLRAPPKRYFKYLSPDPRVNAVQCKVYCFVSFIRKSCMGIQNVLM
jgi:hypothetical protein